MLEFVCRAAVSPHPHKASCKICFSATGIASLMLSQPVHVVGSVEAALRQRSRGRGLGSWRGQTIF